MILMFFKEYRGWYLLYLLIGIGLLGMFALYRLPFDFILQSLFFTSSLLAIWSVVFFYQLPTQATHTRNKSL
ncbi:hypothetical protein MU448_05520 [Streptococcus sp. O1]|nr:MULTISPECIES: hypothetical protein [unclassified Streptococcus]MCQ9212555.1 hypothetical protein [Streptococcus sp. B01]MCQ9213894.1 hypothetical protein [Streptococcus sp. O1]